MSATDMVMISVDDLFNIDRMRTAFGVEISTPNFDRLKALGVTFNNANASVALCNPSRTSILTGQNPFETGVHTNATTWYDSVDPSQTIPAFLKAAGYTTMGFGKTFHSLEMPAAVEQAMFDQYYAPSSTLYDFDSPVRWGELPGDPDATGDALAINAALTAMAGHDGLTPLFMMVGLVDPHAPFLSPTQYLDLYPLDQIVLPEWDGDSPPPYALSFIDPTTVQYFQNSGELVKLVQGYLANISEMDYRLGLLLDGIAASGLNPTIMLYSDHGYHLGDHDTLHKFTLWEQAANAPLIIYHPDTLSGGQVHDGVVSLLDLAPTILEIAGVTVPGSMEGHSLLASILDASEPTFGTAITTMGGSFSLRTGDWRYTRYQDGSEELFQISTDAENKHNLASVPEFALDLAALSAILDTKLAEMGVEFDVARQMSVFEALNGDTQYFVVDETSLVDVVDSVGVDTIFTAAVVFTLPEWAERLVGIGRAGMTVTGHGGDNFIGGSGQGDIIFGLEGNDELEGASGGDQIYGGIGNDTVMGGSGNDSLQGDEGDDVLTGSYGFDTLLGGDGIDRLDGGTEADQLFGGMGDDRVLGGAGDDGLNGDEGIDYLLGHAGADLMHGGSDGDTVLGGSGNDLIFGDGGDDRLFGGDNDDSLDGGEGADLLKGDAGDDVLDGNSENDRLFGGTGLDQLIGGIGNDRLMGGDGNDILTGGDGADRMWGEADDDQLDGGLNNDVLDGGTGNDVIDGGRSNDTLIGGDGDDTLTGGLGADKFSWAALSVGTDLVTDFVIGTDVFALTGVLVDEVVITVDGLDTLVAFQLQTIRLSNVSGFDVSHILIS